MTTPFFNVGGAAFTDMRCVRVAGWTKIKNGTRTQGYGLRFEAVASDWLAACLTSQAGTLKVAPLDDLEVRVGFYPRYGDTFTVDATATIKIMPDDIPLIRIDAKILREYRDNPDDYEFDLMTFAPWLEQFGAVILRPTKCNDTRDMFDDGAIPPLTIHDPDDTEPRVTSATGYDLLDLLHINDATADDDPVEFIGSAEGDNE
jgi:hypothetical protein